MVVYKYCANGNDFLIFHSFVKKDYSNLARKICNRFSGIGADGLVVLLPHSKYAYEWEFYNSDGSIANMCGNASRCAGHYAYSLGLAKSDHSFLTRAGEIQINIDKSIITSNLGEYKDIKDLGKFESFSKEICDLDKLNLLFDSSESNDIAGTKDNESKFSPNDFKNFIITESSWHYINTGVPHLVCFVNNKKLLPMRKNKLMLALRERFDANVNFVYLEDSANLSVCTYERGVEDITLACGTGMAACFVIGHLFFNLKNHIKATPPSLESIDLWLEDKKIFIKGAVSKVGICVVDDEFVG